MVCPIPQIRGGRNQLEDILYAPNNYYLQTACNLYLAKQRLNKKQAYCRTPTCHCDSTRSTRFCQLEVFILLDHSFYRLLRFCEILFSVSAMSPVTCYIVKRSRHLSCLKSTDDRTYFLLFYLHGVALLACSRSQRYQLPRKRVSSFQIMWVVVHDRL